MDIWTWREVWMGSYNMILFLYLNRLINSLTLCTKKMNFGILLSEPLLFMDIMLCTFIQMIIVHSWLICLLLLLSLQRILTHCILLYYLPQINWCLFVFILLFQLMGSCYQRFDSCARMPHARTKLQIYWHLFVFILWHLYVFLFHLIGSFRLCQLLSEWLPRKINNSNNNDVIRSIWWPRRRMSNNNAAIWLSYQQQLRRRMNNIWWPRRRMSNNNTAIQLSYQLKPRRMDNNNNAVNINNISGSN